jgi:hypothetical protein
MHLHQPRGQHDHVRVVRTPNVWVDDAGGFSFSLCRQRLEAVHDEAHSLRSGPPHLACVAVQVVDQVALPVVEQVPPEGIVFVGSSTANAFRFEWRYHRWREAGSKAATHRGREPAGFMAAVFARVFVLCLFLSVLAFLFERQWRVKASKLKCPENPIDRGWLPAKGRTRPEATTSMPASSVASEVAASARSNRSRPGSSVATRDAKAHTEEASGESEEVGAVPAVKVATATLADRSTYNGEVNDGACASASVAPKAANLLLLLNCRRRS